MEQVLVYLYDTPTLRTELGCRLVEAKAILRPALTAWYAEQCGRAQSPDEQRPLLARIINDLQWRYTVNELKRQYAKVVTRKTGMVFVVALLLFAAAYLLHVFGMNPSGDQSSALSLAFTAGLFGASFSLLSSLKSRLDVAELDDLKIMRYYGAIMTRALIGSGGALIVYFFLRSGLLAGSAFPKLGRVSMHASRDLALLVVWCFVAGFSEKLVPGLIGRTEGRADDHLMPAPRPSATETADSPPKPSDRRTGDEAIVPGAVAAQPAAST
jgi:hypothetical protein